MPTSAHAPEAGAIDQGTTPPAVDKQQGAPTRLAALDGFRFLAATMVAIFHMLAVGGLGVGGSGVQVFGQPAKEAFGSGVFFVASYLWVGVPLFFMISGFVICMSSWGRTPAQFAISRFVRLYPAYWVCVLLAAVVLAVYPYVFTPLFSWRQALVNLTMFQQATRVGDLDTVYWTLRMELGFYLLFLLVVWRGVTYNRVLTFCLLWSLASISAPMLNLPWLNVIVLPGQSQYFIAGVALYLMHRHGPHLVLWLILGLSWVMSMHYYQGNAWQGVQGQPYWPAGVLISLCFLALTLLALGKLDWLRWRGLTTLGAVTYPLYLLHNVVGVSVIYFLHSHFALPPVALLTMVLGGTVVLAWLVHRLIERPVAPWLKRELSRAVARMPERGGSSRPPSAGPEPESDAAANGPHGQLVAA